MSSRNNVAKRGSTWTYYVYIVGPDGRRRQISKGGFSTRREAESARVAAVSTIGAGMFVRPERITVGEFLVDEWLPTQRPPTLEESTYRSYARYVRLHVVPYVGAIPLQRLTPMDLNSLYRKLLDEGRCRPLPPRRAHGTILVERVKALRRDGRSYEAIAELVADEFPEEAGLTRHAVAALHRRSTLAARPKPMASPGLKPRTVRYVHTIIHAALKDAMGWNRVARNVADAATAPPVGATRSPRPQAWSSDQLRRFLDHVADGRYLPAWVFLATTGCRRGECLGLKWADIDLDAGTAIISRQVTTIDHVLVEKELPKTKYGHLIRLDTGTVGMLRSWRHDRTRRSCSSGSASWIEVSSSASRTGDRTTPIASAGSSSASRSSTTGHTPRTHSPGWSYTVCVTHGRPSPSTKASTSRSSPSGSTIRAPT